MKKIIIDFWTDVFSFSQVYAGLLRVRISDYVLLLHFEEDKLRNAQDFQPLLVTIKNPALQEAVNFVEGPH